MDALVMGTARLACAAALLAAAAGCFEKIGPCGPALSDESLALPGGARVCARPLAEALLARRGVFAQTVSGDVRGRPFVADCVMKSDGLRLTAVFLSQQARLATLTYSGADGLGWTHDEHVPRAAGPVHVLFDMACVNLAPEDLRRALGEGFRVVEDGSSTRVFAPSGTPIAEVARARAGLADYRNLALGYGYSVRERTAE